MMRGRLLIGLAACVSVLAVSAASATADEFAGETPFVGSQAPPVGLVRGSSGSAGLQQFNVGALQITCASAKAVGAVSPDLIQASVKFRDCTVADHFGTQTLELKASIKEPVTDVYSPSGRSGMGPVTIDLPSLKCSIYLGEGSAGGNGGAGAGRVNFSDGPSLYYNESTPTRDLHIFPTGLQQKLRVKTEMQEIVATFTGTCEGFEPLKTATYSGTLWYESQRHNLSYANDGSLVEGGGPASEESGEPEQPQEGEGEWNKIENKKEPGSTVEPEQPQEGEWSKVENK